MYSECTMALLLAEEDHTQRREVYTQVGLGGAPAPVSQVWALCWVQLSVCCSEGSVSKVCGGGGGVTQW